MKRLYPHVLLLRRSCVFSAAAIVTLFFFTLEASAGTGTIHGTVKGGGTALVGATVRILELNRLEYTNAQGEFDFANVPDGSYKVFARILGYAAATNAVQVAGGPTETAFDLRESAIEVGEVIISGSPYARTAADEYQSATAKSLVELHASPGSGFSEKISDLPGVAVRGNGSAPNRPVLRGLSDNRVLILENGLRTGDLSTYDPAHATPIEALSASQIDVVRGPASILYGPSTIGGLVNVITNTIPTPASHPFSGSVSLEGNSVSDLYSGFFNGVFTSGADAIGVTAGGVHAQDIHIPEATYSDGVQDFLLNRLPQSFDRSHEVSLGYSHQGDFGTIGIGGKFYQMNYGIPGTPANDNWETLGDPAATSRIFQIKKSLEARGLFSVDGSLVKRISVNANYVDYNHAEYPTAQDSTGVYDFLATRFHKKTYNATLQFQHQTCEKFQGVFGLWSNVEDMTIDGDDPLGPNSSTTGLAGYLYEEYLSSEMTRFQAGLRFDYNHIQTNPEQLSTNTTFQTLNVSRNSNAVTASLGLIQTLSNELTFSANLARSFRAPTVQELFADGLDAPSGTYTIGNADLNPESGYGIDLSLKGNMSSFAFELSPYLNIMKEYIYGFLTGADSLGFPIREFASTDARLMGVEATIAAQIVNDFSVKVSADYVEAQDTKNDVPLPFTPPLRGLLKFLYRNATWSGDLEWRLAAKQTRLGDGDTPTQGYGVVNLGAGMRFVEGGIVHSISVHCDNALNQSYRDHLSVIKDFVPQPARGFRLNYDLIY